MTAALPAMPPARRVRAGDITLSVHEAGPQDGLPVLLLHGWPDLALGWAPQIAALSGAGYRVIAPDLRGFGASDAPPEIKAYGIDAMCTDIENLLDALGVERAVIAGHDWGGIILWQAACLIAHRFLGAIGVNTPHLPRSSTPPLDVFREQGGEEHYIVRFQDEAADEVFAGREEDFFAFSFGSPPPSGDLAKLPASITHLPRRFDAFLARGGLKSEDDCVVPPQLRAQYAEAYRRSGFRGGLNLYRNFNANWERMGGVDHRLSMPCLMISAECDFMLPPRLAAWMPALCRDLERHVIEDIGHWTMAEAPDALNALMLDWLTRRF